MEVHLRVHLTRVLAGISVPGAAIPVSRQVDRMHSIAFALSHSQSQLRVKEMSWIFLLSAACSCQPAAPQGPGACRQCLPQPHCPAHHHFPKPWGRALQWARSGKSSPGCDNKAEECKHALQVTGDFSLFFDKVKSRKDHALSAFIHDYSLLGVFPTPKH